MVHPYPYILVTFKAIGNQSGAVQSLKDGFEALKIGKFELDGRWAPPSVAQDNLDLFDQFTAACHFISKLLLDCISDELGLKGDARLENPTKIGQNMHTDIGSLTILHAPQWGLQVFSPEDATWKYVVPRLGHAIVNVGDTLRFLSNKRSRSALHRVLPQGHVQTEDRYSILYFLRASDSTEFEDSNGEYSRAKQWYLKRYEMYELPHTIQKEHTTLSGGMAQELQATF
ncbi:2OG-Fe(II) oxygenase family protein [Aspergillus vadensis CBS 113365]|uniref:Clavaminate synthase-like protein n=1 Tax=Aspergillus vadensis (strain CBS 113365 / IMI 142717 / IBT 24658) TaxID=1448311 RepID=A0A319AZB0_ASPVC|nr:Clavaminate synthase-like protein [Aspergillus vadensis CBS 113365]PYH64914.1 Clavaminate synthase-like protein [Aspergillus vadensis CBS 113365]